MSLVTEVRDMIWTMEMSGSKNDFIHFARRIVDYVRPRVESEDRALLRETLGYLDAYDFRPSQFNGLRGRIRKHIDRVGV